MKRVSRYWLVGILVSVMVVDNAAAGRLFRRLCRSCGSCPKCQVVCPPPALPASVPSVPGVCLASEDPTWVDLAYVAPSAQLVEADYVDTDCQACPSNAQPEIVTEASEVVTEVVTEELAMPSPALAEQEEKITVEPQEPSVAIPPPVPLAVPEASETDPVPTFAEPASDSEVGDRYSNKTDLFGSPVPEPAAPLPPAVVPAAIEETSELFKEPTPDAEEVTAPETELPTPREAEPSAPDSRLQSELDNASLFGPSDLPEEESEEQVIEETPEETPEETEGTEPSAPAEPMKYHDPFGDDDHFGQPGGSPVLEEAGGLQSEANRTWSDETATFRCQARLIRITAKQVVLQRPTGSKLVVPLSRLGSSDLQFVHQQIVALRVVRTRESAAAHLAVAWSR